MLRQLLSSHDNGQSMVLYLKGMNHATGQRVVIFSFGITHAPSVVIVS